MFCEKLCSMIIWFSHQIVYSSICCDKFKILVSMFSHVFSRFSKNWIIYQPEKVFVKVIFCFFLRSVFISIYGFSQLFWLNLVTLWTFFKTNPWFNAYFKFLLCLTYPVLSCKLPTSFSTFLIFILSGKKGKSLWNSCNFSGYWTSTSTKFFVIAF